MITTQGPAIPDLNVLKDLPQGLAYSVLGLILIGMILYYTNGFGLRQRFAPKPPPPDPPVSPPALPQIVDTAEQVRREFIDNLLRQVTAADTDRDEMKAELRELRETTDREIRGLIDEVGRLKTLLWQRGAS